MTRDEIDERVAQALVQALGVSRKDITLDTSLAGDLEAESIDFLDVVFRLEKDFGIEVARGGALPAGAAARSRDGQQRPAHAAGVAALRRRFAFTDLSSPSPASASRT